MKEEDVKDYLDSVHKLARKKCFKVSNRDKNFELIRQYKLNDSKIRDILLKLETKDFIGIKDSNITKGNKLWEFCKEYELDFYGEIDKKLIYIKLDNTKRIERIEIVSLHEAEHEPRYVFK